MRAHRKSHMLPCGRQAGQGDRGRQPWQAHARGAIGSGKQSRRNSKTRKSGDGTINSAELGKTVRARAACGPACSSGSRCGINVRKMKSGRQLRPCGKLGFCVVQPRCCRPRCRVRHARAYHAKRAGLFTIGRAASLRARAACPARSIHARHGPSTDPSLQTVPTRAALSPPPRSRTGHGRPRGPFTALARLPCWTLGQLAGCRAGSRGARAATDAADDEAARERRRSLACASVRRGEVYPCESCVDIRRDRARHGRDLRRTI